MWVHYVLAHLDFFLQFNYYFYLSQLYHPILTAFMIFSLVALVIRSKTDLRFLFLLAGITNVIFLDYFVAVIGDNPGSFGRHINLSSKLIQFSYTLLSCYGLYALIEFLSAFFNFFTNLVQNDKAHEENILETHQDSSNNSLLINIENSHSSKSPSIKWHKNTLVLGICEGIGLLMIGIFSWGTISETIFYYKGIGHYYDKQYTQMISDLDKSLFLRKLMGKPKPQIANIYHWKAQGNLNLQQNEQAIINFSKATEFNPNDSTSYLNLGTLYQNQGQNELAIEKYTKAIQTRPNLPDAYRGRGLLYMNLSKFEEAYKDLSIAIQLKSNDLLSYLNRAKILMNIKQSELALQDLNKILEYKDQPGGTSTIEPGRVNLFKGEAHNMRGHLSQQKGQNEQALEEFTKAIQFNPNNISPYLSHSRLLIVAQKYEPALQDLNKVLSLKNDVAEAYDLRGYIYLIGQRNKTAACQNFKRACDLGMCNNYQAAKNNKDCP